MHFFLLVQVARAAVHQLGAHCVANVDFISQLVVIWVIRSADQWTSVHHSTQCASGLSTMVVGGRLPRCDRYHHQLVVIDSCCVSLCLVAMVHHWLVLNLLVLASVSNTLVKHRSVEMRLKMSPFQLPSNSWAYWSLLFNLHCVLVYSCPCCSWSTNIFWGVFWNIQQMLWSPIFLYWIRLQHIIAHLLRRTNSHWRLSVSAPSASLEAACVKSFSWLVEKATHWLPLSSRAIGAQAACGERRPGDLAIHWLHLCYRAMRSSRWSSIRCLM